MFFGRTHFPKFLLCFIVVAQAGCSDYGGRHEVTGTVVLEGNPLKEGSISFHPLDAQETQSGGPIVNGKYKVPRNKGLRPGKYLVRISAGDGRIPVNSEAAQPGGSTNIVSVDRIPEEWSAKSKQQVEVTSDGPNKFDFDIPKANTAKKR